MKRIVPLGIIIAGLAVCALLVLDPCTGRLSSAREAESQSFKLRWEVRAAACSLDWHPVVVFKSAPAGSNEWREVMTSWTDEPSAIPSDKCLNFIDAQTGYVYFNEKYAVTSDRGQTWTVWDAKRQLSHAAGSSIYISDVNIGADGYGWMQLTIYSNQPSLRKLSTKDYGYHWEIE